MTTPSEKPAIYISSTIFDFRDLRSALKYTLEELGYKVYLSEFNDFPKALDKNSYEACLKAIGQANYFILLVGARVGGFYDEKERVSITRMEYRHAYELAKNDKIKLLVFVRREILDVREDRKELKRILDQSFATQKELSPAEIEKLATHSSTHVNSAQITFEFLSEIGKVKDMKAAVAGKGVGYPKANWIHAFNSFGEIMDALEVEFRISDTLRRATLRVNLENEIFTNLGEMLSKYDKHGTVRASTENGKFARRALVGGIRDSSAVKGEHLLWLGLFLMESNGVYNRLNTVALNTAIESGEFLEYSGEIDAYVVGSLQQALLDLRANIFRMKFLFHSWIGAPIEVQMQRWISYKDHGENRVVVPNIELANTLAVHDCMENILQLSVAIVKVCGGDWEPLKRLKLLSTSPFEVEAIRLQDSKVSHAEVKNWIENEARKRSKK